MKINIPFIGEKKKTLTEGKPQTLIWTGKRPPLSFSDRGGRKIKDLKKYWQYYENEQTVWAAINSITYNTVMTGYSLVSDEEEAKIYIEDLCEYINLEDVLLDSTRYTLIYGDAFIEKRRNKKGAIIDLYAVDPKTIIAHYNKYGRVEYYQQIINGTLLEKTIEPKDIIHIKFFNSPDSPYGISILKPNEDTIIRKVRTDEALFNAIQRHGTSKLVAYVGDKDDGIPSEEVMESIQEKLEDITEINDFVVPWLIKIDTIDEKGVQGVNEYYDLFQNQLIVGLMCPEEALGQGKGSTEATARIKAILYERMIKSFQRKLSNIIKKELFNEQLKLAGYVDKKTDRALNVRIKFNSVTEEDDALRAKWIGNLLRGFPEGLQPFSINEIRGLMGLPHRKGMDDLYVKQKRETGSEIVEEPDANSVEEEPEEEEENEDIDTTEV
jgi:hypothetical protein